MCALSFAAFTYMVKFVAVVILQYCLLPPKKNTTAIIGINGFVKCQQDVFLNLKYQTSSRVRILRWAASKRSPAVANEKEKTGKCLQLDVEYLHSMCLLQRLYHLLSQDFDQILTPHNVNHDSQLTMLIIPYLCLPTEVKFNHPDICEIPVSVATLESLLQTADAWPPIAFKGLCCQKLVEIVCMSLVSHI